MRDGKDDDEKHNDQTTHKRKKKRLGRAVAGLVPPVHVVIMGCCEMHTTTPILHTCCCRCSRCYCCPLFALCLVVVARCSPLTHVAQPCLLFSYCLLLHLSNLFIFLQRLACVCSNNSAVTPQQCNNNNNLFSFQLRYKTKPLSV
jgi:hypothetical protein